MLHLKNRSESTGSTATPPARQHIPSNLKDRATELWHTLTSISYHMCAGGIFQFCGSSTILLQHLCHVLPFIIWETTKTHSCTMERLQLVTNLQNRNKLQVRLGYSMFATQFSSCHTCPYTMCFFPQISINIQGVHLTLVFSFFNTWLEVWVSIMDSMT
jgi:hypothetical protein